MNGWTLFVDANFRICVLAVLRFQRTVWRYKVGWRAEFFLIWPYFTRFSLARGLARMQVPLYSEADYRRRFCIVRTPQDTSLKNICQAFWRQYAQRPIHTYHALPMPRPCRAAKAGDILSSSHVSSRHVRWHTRISSCHVISCELLAPDSRGR